ncbi:hypothetical protein I3760_03G207800 [Carya illinoinensis]|uniref:Uncharacterized protein n=4 Tax=Carya illinoinensis TaxID=32201 RepID=A0A922K166_CARIL|nr:uncharacterized protein LOC122304369 [Carya illinoinensis]KAG2718177.1 hypothetical protein I3760_03G207800 [Carya illinoinensis]KAG6723397.1 hypothetical protein I3842_03G205400 [Carya illinoinensis]
MTTVPEVTDLIARLALHLKALNEEDVEETLGCSISLFNKSLNLDEDSRVSVLDTALSLMCFKAPQVFNSMLEYLVQTIVTVLSSSISCEVFRVHTDEVLRVGSSFSRHDCFELIEACADVTWKLEGHGTLSQMLSCALVRLVISASCCRYLLPSIPVLVPRSIHRRSIAVSQLLCQFHRDFSFKDYEVPFRLLSWYLDPLTLKHDLLKIFQDTMERPFISLNEEFHERMDWRHTILCLVLSPTMFIETRALLHSWLLLTGLASVQEFLTKLISIILDVISRPSWWGLSVELGSKLPFSNAYFPYNHRLLRILAGPLSTECLMQLSCSVSKPASHAWKDRMSAIKPAVMKTKTFGHKSSWALAINFPDWFYFASVLLFTEEHLPEYFHSKFKLVTAKIGETHDMEPPYSAAAARYIGWILSPTSKYHQDMLVPSLTKISDSWMPKQFGSVSRDKDPVCYNEKPKRPNLGENRDHTLTKVRDCQTIGLWLKEFQDIGMWYWNETVNSQVSCEEKSPNGLNFQQNVLFRRIPLGALIGCSNNIDEDGCQMLLHYAATGRILQSVETKCTKLKHAKWSSVEWEESVRWTDKCNKREAVAGACLVFSLTDTVESMSDLLFDSEESGLQFISRFKLRACKYLINCIKKLIQLTIDEDVVMLMDLSSRLAKWRHQGQELSQVDRDLDGVINSLSHKLSSL